MTEHPDWRPTHIRWIVIRRPRHSLRRRLVNRALIAALVLASPLLVALVLVEELRPDGWVANVDLNARE